MGVSLSSSSVSLSLLFTENMGVVVVSLFVFTEKMGGDSRVDTTTTSSSSSSSSCGPQPHVLDKRWGRKVHSINPRSPFRPSSSNSPQFTVSCCGPHENCPSGLWTCWPSPQMEQGGSSPLARTIVGIIHATTNTRRNE